MPGRPAADRRINIYIDGYNFYVPLSTMGEKHYELCWCDFLDLGTGIANSLAQKHPHEFGGCHLGLVKYFTATIPYNMPKDPGGIERKHLWLDALHYHSQGRVEIIHGTFRPRKHRFYIERAELDNLARSGIPIQWDLVADGATTFHPDLKIHEEKQTDVMLACSLLTDAALGRAGATNQIVYKRHRTIGPMPGRRLRPVMPPWSSAPISISCRRRKWRHASFSARSQQRSPFRMSNTNLAIYGLGPSLICSRSKSMRTNFGVQCYRAKFCSPMAGRATFKRLRVRISPA